MLLQISNRKFSLFSQKSPMDVYSRLLPESISGQISNTVRAVFIGWCISLLANAGSRDISRVAKSKRCVPEPDPALEAITDPDPTF